MIKLMLIIELRTYLLNKRKFESNHLNKSKNIPMNRLNLSKNIDYFSNHITHSFRNRNDH